MVPQRQFFWFVLTKNGSKVWELVMLFFKNIKNTESNFKFYFIFTNI